MRSSVALTLLGPQSRFGDKSLGIVEVCPQIGAAVLKGLSGLYKYSFFIFLQSVVVFIVFIIMCVFLFWVPLPLLPPLAAYSISLSPVLRGGGFIL